MYEFYDGYTKISWYCNTSPLNNILILCTLNNNNKRKKISKITNYYSNSLYQTQKSNIAMPVIAWFLQDHVIIVQ